MTERVVKILRLGALAVWLGVGTVYATVPAHAGNCKDAGCGPCKECCGCAILPDGTICLEPC
jgi:hypothetical protein